MKLINKIVVATALLALVAGAFAQGGRRGGFAPNKYQILNSADVQTDLKLTPDQVAKLKDVQTKAQEEMRSAMENARASGSFDPSAMEATRKKMDAEYTPQYNAILTPDQQTRLQQIFVQWRKNSAILDPEVQTALGITDAQKQQITDLQTKMQEANRAIGEKIQSGELSREDAAPLREKNNAALNDELGKILTADQTAKLKDMGGAPFTGKIQMGFGGRRGGPGGGGGRGGNGGGGGGTGGGGGIG